MTKIEYTVRFLTPAFLGNAEQSGQWRTPPFKALLRQWWRVVYAAEHSFRANAAEMRQEEGKLFGHAWLDEDRDSHGQKVAARKSLVRIRLDRWDEGKLKSWQPLTTVKHPEVRFPVGSDLYLGYGPVTLPRGANQPKLKANAAIQADESATLSLAVPEEEAPRIRRALWLMDRYGTLGGRSRNGWGSFSMVPLPLEEGKGDGRVPTGGVPLRDWNKCLDRDWPHAIGKDDRGPLIWQTAKAYEDWKTLMRDLAIIKIGLRTQFVFPSVQPPHATVEPRHWLSYPTTTHKVRDWQKKKLRLSNSLRFKVRPDEGSPKKLRGVIFHVPCLPPPEFNPNPNRYAIEATWQTVHALLDELCKPGGRTYGMISHQDRRSKLKPDLDKVTLERVKE
ncbi:MAG: RAMP superfamily CRISPR-associated protein [Nitrospirota bacterium]